MVLLAGEVGSRRESCIAAGNSGDWGQVLLKVCWKNGDGAMFGHLLQCFWHCMVQYYVPFIQCFREFAEGFGGEKRL